MVFGENDRCVGFIISHQRSGSTYLRTCLNQIKAISAPSESHFLIEYYRDLSMQTDRKRLLKMIESHQRLTHWRKEHLNEYVLCRSVPEFFFDFLADQSPEKKPRIIFDKTPEYLDIVDKLVVDFKNAKFIFLVRHGVDVALSLENRGWQGPFQENRMQYWSDGCRKMLCLAKELSPDRYLTMRYEDIMTNPTTVAEQLSAFLGVQIRPENLEPNHAIQMELTEKERKLGIHNALTLGKKVDRQRRNLISKKQRDYMVESMGEMLHAFGYVTELPKQTPMQKVRYHILCFIGILTRYIPAKHAQALAKFRRKFIPKRAFID